MHAAFAALGRFSVRFRWPVIVVWLLAAGAIIALLPSLSSVVQNNNTAFLPANTPSQRAAVLAAPFQRAGETGVPIVVAADHTLTSSDQAYLDRLIPDLRAVRHVDAVRDLGRSPDGMADQVQVLTSVAGGQDGAIKSLVTGLRAATTRAGPPSGVTAEVTGQLAIQVDQNAKSGNTGGQVEKLSILFIFVLLLLIFRSLLAPLVTLVPAILVAGTAGPVIAELAHHGLKVSSLAQLMLIVLVLGAGTDYGLFLVFRVRENLRAGLDKREAVVRGVERVGESITASAGTVIAALLSLFAASFGVYHDLGAPLAIGIALMLLAALTLLPALLSVLGRAVFWPSRIAPLPEGEAERPGWWGSTAARIVRRPAATLAVGVVLFGGLAVAVTGYTSAGFASATNPPSGSGSAIGAALLARHFPSDSSNPTNVLFRYRTSVWTDPTPVAQADGVLTHSPVFTHVTGPLDPNGRALTGSQLTALHRRFGDPQSLGPTAPSGVDPSLYAAYRSESQYVSPDGLTVNYDTALAAGDPSTTAALHAVPATRTATARAAAASGATASGVTGEAPGLYDVSAVSTSDLESVVPIAIAVIGVLLALVMRSLVAPLYLIVSVGLSYLAALGVSVLVFQEALHSGGLTFILPFLMFLFLLALGEDYNILVMTRIREEAHHRPLREAVTAAVRATGTTVTSAGVVLAGTFAVFAVAGSRGAGGSQFRDIGAGLAIGILMDTFLVRTLLVPATVVLLGRWNWWPSRIEVDRPLPSTPVRTPLPR